VIIDHPNFVQYKWNLIDTDLLDYYHIMHLCSYKTKNMHYTKPPEVDCARPSMARLRNMAWAVFGPPGISK